MISRRPLSTGQLQPSERRLVRAIELLGFGRFEHLKIQNGEPVLAPWPLTIRGIKFGGNPPDNGRTGAKEVQLKHQFAALLEYIRGVRTGEISILAFRHGLPFAMEIELRTDPDGSNRDA
jgi:hypothetical protein